MTEIDFKGTFGEAELEQLQRINEEKRLKALDVLGEKWILHPSNHVKRITKFKLKRVKS